MTPTPERTARRAWSHPGFRRYQFVRIATILGLQMQAVAVAWQVYDLTRRPLDLGYLGLVQFIPVLALWPITGLVVDRIDRRRVVAVCIAIYAVAAAGLCALSLGVLGAGITSVTPLFVALSLVAAARAFGQPASQALLPQLVPIEDFTNAVTWTSSLFQLGTIVGPAIGGFILGFVGVSGVYAATAVLCALAALVSLTVEVRPLPPPPPRGRVWDEVFAGVRFLRGQPVVLGAITLDLFAVLFGGAVALLPVYARDILHAGPLGFGALRASPALGATCMAIFLAFHPVGGRAGKKMLAAVAIFGLATLAFGVSTHIVASVIALVIAGAADELSVVVRQTLIQLGTPDDMRGRVSAVNFVFIGISNEIGELESGLAAALFGTVPAVVLGALGTLAVVTGGWFLAPALRDVDRLERG